MTPLVEKQIPEQAKARGITEAAGDLATCCSRRSRPSASSPSKSCRQLVNFLCTDDARSITGTALPVDGGWTAH